ncbi:MAG: L,D-transpeptidase family protein [Alphaproteobacteria bacterium]|nr:L,D-transpeptidase family protein [Alphaproteobacteria bacterium]
MSKKGELVLRSFLPVAAAALLVPLPQVAHARATEAAKPAPTSIAKQIAQRSGDLSPFYAARANEPLWLTAAGEPSPAVAALLDKLRSAKLDDVDTAPLQLDQVYKLVDAAPHGTPDAVALADIALSRTFARYVQAMRGAPHVAMLYESPALAPSAPGPRQALEAAAKAPSLEGYIDAMAWMHPLYAPLRAALDDPQYTLAQRQVIAANLERVRAIPQVSEGKYILVDAANAQLWMYDGDKVVDTMKVVVGNPVLGETPMMAGWIRWAIENPYWEVPNDIVQKEIAPEVLKSGVRYLKAHAYEVLAGWDADSPILDPSEVDWHAVHDGSVQVHVRQRPGGENFMGKVKFEFPNAKGIYLHDTPAKQLMKKDARQLSHGCIRMENAALMHEWLMGEPIPASAPPEEKVPLDKPVPIYVTYLTALPSGGQIAFHADPYKRDTATQLAIADIRGPKTDRP